MNGLVCKNSDTMPLFIPERLNTAFLASTGTDEFCDSDAPASIIHGISSPDSVIWKVGGVPQALYEFHPIPLDPGIHVVELVATDSVGCSYSTLDTFTIHGLPIISTTPTIGGQYCTNDDTVQFIINPGPYCTDFDSTTSQFVLNQNLNYNQQILKYLYYNKECHYF